MKIAIVGCGTAGAASGVLLARQGHTVTVFERVPSPSAVGAGFLLQPTGVHVLSELGIAEEVTARASRVHRLLATTRGGRTVLSLRYEDLASGLCGFGVHRGLLFHALTALLAREPVPLETGVDVVSLSARGSQRFLHTLGGKVLGPFDLIVIADGARSKLRGVLYEERRRDRTYPWGALWFMGDDPRDAAEGSLRQGVDGARTMAGLLPTGRRHDAAPGSPALLSLFWSIAHTEVARWRETPLERWKEDVRRVLPQAEVVLAQIHGHEQLTFAAYQDVELERWHQDGVVVLGDAAHAMSPQLGQGVNLALWDAFTLAECLRDRTVDDALRLYSHTREDTLRYYTWATRMLTPFFQSRLLPLGWLRDAFMGPLCGVPLFRQQMLLSLAGLHRGFVKAPLPLLGTPSPRLDLA